MYVPAHFAMSEEQVRDVLRRCRTADLVTVEDGVPVATLLPFEYDADAGPYGTLLTHVTRNNTQWRASGEVLVIAHHTDHYVSPAGLPSTAEEGRTVPTWDYVVVHAYGPVVVHEDETWLRTLVDRVTARYEGEGGWRSTDVPGDHISRMLRAAVGVEIPISRVVGKTKFSQNKSPADVETLMRRQELAGDEAGATVYREVSLPAAQARADLLADVARRRGS